MGFFLRQTGQETTVPGAPEEETVLPAIVNVFAVKNPINLWVCT
jgi:hypothetical protein